MTTSVLPAWAASKNLQARTTGGILNIVRYAGTAVFGLIAAILVIAGFVEWADPHTSGLTAVLILIGVGTTTVAALLFYAIVGWYVDSLALLTQIAGNTTARSALIG